MIDLLMTIGLEAMAENADASPQALAAMMRMQAWSMLINVVQLIGYVLIIAAICRAVLWPERAPGRFFDLRVGMDEARVAVAGLAVMAVIMGRIAVVAKVAHDAGKPLIVDEAWGSHFGFHPELPTNAIRLGADLVISSTHKLAGSLTQSAMLHLGDGELRTVVVPG